MEIITCVKIIITALNIIAIPVISSFVCYYCHYCKASIRPHPLNKAPVPTIKTPPSLELASVSKMIVIHEVLLTQAALNK